MTRVDFYIVEKAREDRLGIVCRLAQKAYDAGQRAHLHVADAAQAKRLDTLLWTFHQGSFINDRPASGVDQYRTSFHHCQLFFADHTPSSG